MTMHVELFGMVLKLLLAVILGGLIGLEREAHGRPAGLRTHILVSLGAVLFTIVSSEFGGQQFDPGRIAAQIVSGIGFLGAGTIIRQGSIIRGLTTAASLWATAAIGMSVGAGGVLTYLAIVASVIVFVTLSLVSRLEHAAIIRFDTRELELMVTGGRASIAAVTSLLARFHVAILGMRTEDVEPSMTSVEIRMRSPASVDVAQINTELAAMPDIVSIEWS